MSDLKSVSSVSSDFPMDKYACQVDDQFLDLCEHEVTDDHIDNCIFIIDHYQYDLNLVLSSFVYHYSEEKIVNIDDQNLITRKLEGY